MNGPASSPENPSPAPPKGWREGIAELLAARIELVQIEAREAARSAARKGMLAGICLAAAYFTWVLLLAGCIGWGAHILARAGHPDAWPWLALAAAALHGLVALLCILALRRPSPPPFPVTRTELERDREWLKSLQTPRG